MDQKHEFKDFSIAIITYLQPHRDYKCMSDNNLIDMMILDNFEQPGKGKNKNFHV